MMQNIYLDQKPGRTAMVNGKEFIFFSGYNYLGISGDAEFNELVLEGAAKYGWLFPSSRISNTRLALYEECEATLSQITNSEDTVLMPSGFTAGRAAISHHGAQINNAPGSHPAILQHKSALNTFDEWVAQLLQQDTKIKFAEPLIIATDSVNQLTSAIHDFSFLNELTHPITAIIDDSHGIGITGINGRGVGARVPKSNGLDYLFTYSTGKAYGIAGGAISCPAEWARRLRALPAYTGVTPMSPAQVYAFNKGQHIYARQRQILLNNITYLETHLQNLPGLQHAKGFPVFVLPTALNEQVLLDQNVLISSFAYPDPAGPTLKRIVLNALHTKGDLDRLALILQDACAGLS